MDHLSVCVYPFSLCVYPFSFSFCQDCGLVFTEKWMLKEHKRVAHDERVIKCDYCNVEIIGLIKMKAHKKKHKQKQCKICSLLVFAFIEFTPI